MKETVRDFVNSLRRNPVGLLGTMLVLFGAAQGGLLLADLLWSHLLKSAMPESSGVPGAFISLSAVLLVIIVLFSSFVALAFAGVYLVQKTAEYLD